MLTSPVLLLITRLSATRTVGPLHTVDRIAFDFSTNDREYVATVRALTQSTVCVKSPVDRITVAFPPLSPEEG